MALEPQFIKLSIVKGAEFQRQASEGLDKPELRGDEVNHEAEPRLLRKLEAMLAFTLRLSQRVSRGQKICVQMIKAVRRKSEVTDFVRSLERASDQSTAGPDMFCPWHNHTCEAHVGPALEALQFTLLDQFIAQLTETKAGLVVAESLARYRAKRCVGDTRTVAVAVLKAEIDHSTDDQRKKVRISIKCSWY